MRVAELLYTSALICLSTVACSDKGEEQDDEDVEVDADGDGFVADVDCDDGDAAINPGAAEVCDGIDNNCNALTDDADPAVDLATGSTWFLDGDGDGFGDSDSAGTVFCGEPDAEAGVWLADNTDCDDGDAAVHPNATEICDDRDVDEDCSGAADDDDPGVDPSTQAAFYPDSDGDGYGSDSASGTAACDLVSGMVADNTDCDDDAVEIHPEAIELCDGIDSNCDAMPDAGLATFVDAEGTVSDYTELLTGSSGAPAVASLGTAGTLRVCEGTWYVHLDVSADVEIDNPSGVPSDVVLDGAATASVITVATDGVSLYLEGLSIENGAGSGESFPYTPNSSGGGIDCTADGASITAMSVDMQNNTAGGAGGAIGALGCALTLEDMVIANNSADYGGGLYVDSADLTLTDSVVSDNSATSYGGGLMAYSYDREVAVALGEVDVRDNVAELLGGGAALVSGYYDVSGSCVGSESTASGFANNAVTAGGDGVGGGLLLYGSALFESEACDFGTSAGGDDNSPDDVGLFARGYAFGSDESFGCFAGFCGNDATYSISNGTLNNDSSQYAAGNIILAETEALLRSFEMKLNSTSSTCTADFYVLSNASYRWTDWTVVYANVGLAIGGASTSISSGDIDLPINPGSYYALVAGSTCTSADIRMGYDFYSSSATDAGFGAAVGYVYESGYSSSYSIGDIVDVGYLSDYYLFETDLVVMGN
ncbi:MAG: hypothetical protein CL927_03345 [Deltaproteobacteria bacterium]|nr:hypothetical protein [Deltaproteobacteria bacterium]